MSLENYLKWSKERNRNFSNIPKFLRKLEVFIEFKYIFRNYKLNFYLRKYVSRNFINIMIFTIENLKILRILPNFSKDNFTRNEFSKL